MKKLILFLILLISFKSSSQELEKPGDIRVINRYLSIVKTDTGFVFIGPEGQKSKEFKKVCVKNEYYIDTTCNNPAFMEEFAWKNPTGEKTPQRGKHVLDLMKELKFIDDYYFSGSNELTPDDIKREFVDEYGSAVKNKKHALIKNNGEFLTDLKYTNGFYDRYSDPVDNYYFKNKALISVLIDKTTGNELITTKDSIAHYYSPGNYVLKNKKDEYHLMHNGQKQKIPEDFKFLINYPPIESTIFTYNNGFFDLNGRKIESDLQPQTNFYKGQCIVKEVIKEKQRYNYYGEPIPQKETRTIKIVNEKLETVKILPELKNVYGYFNKYGQTVVSKRYYNQRDPNVINEFVIDYNGNEIIPTSKIDNRITQVYEGLYLIEDQTYEPTKERYLKYNFYNQKGEKIINDKTIKLIKYLGFKKSTDRNYFTSYGEIYIILDKENNILDSCY
ncbi:hypothetical protein [Flavobacterium gelatinilyticum]|uniref:hypothetical protein n=1 Tax=Flavobacterium gelatinilyticum TaxID=3003260 RepID=UPI00248161C6|nr:hypothetical protein [Flavobacterium gelatinilyticum]